jgi:hypothetical protein
MIPPSAPEGVTLASVLTLFLALRAGTAYPLLGSSILPPARTWTARSAVQVAPLYKGQRYCAIDIHKGDEIDETAPKALIQEAVALNFEREK